MERMSGWRAAIRCLLLAACCALLAVFGFFYFRDNFSTHYPIKVLSQGVWRAGAIPFWNFADGGGQPLAGNPNTLSFYPDNVLYLFLPAHVAFNLHFLLHLIGGWLAMRALTRSRAAAWTYVLSGAAISATAFYNMITAIALIPLALWAVTRRRPAWVGAAFGLLALAGEPVTIGGALIVVLIAGRMRMRDWGLAAVIAAVIASPQLIAYAEIAGEVERAHGYSARTVLNASLHPLQIAEMIVGPVFPHNDPRLFLSLFIGIIAIPALLQRSRYVVAAAVLLFLALGRFNPIVSWAVDAFPSLRIARFPEKLAIPLTVVIVVLAAKFLGNRAWQLVTLIPLAAWAIVSIPIDWFGPYRVTPQAPARIFALPLAGGQEPSRDEYHLRAMRLDPLFGAVAGLRYAVDRSPDGMFSLATRIANERFMATQNEKWLRIAGCTNVEGALPRAWIVPRTIEARDPVRAIEDPSFDEHTAAVAPIAFTSAADAQVTRFVEHPQSLEIGVASSGPVLLFVNETYFRAWDAGGLRTVPLDLDRLGVLVPAGTTTVTLRFGRHHAAVLIAWIVSILTLLVIPSVARDPGGGRRVDVPPAPPGPSPSLRSGSG